MATVIHRKKLSPTLSIFVQSNSANWIARMKVNQTYISRTTKTSCEQEATERAFRLLIEYEIRVNSNLMLVNNKRFGLVARKVISNMQTALGQGQGKVIYADYINALFKYHIPFFENIAITHIDDELLEKFNQWRIEKLGRVPAKSTILNHNAAFMQIFDYAVKKKWLLPSQVPTLENKGVSGQRRAALSPQEYLTVRQKIEQLLLNSRKEVTRQIRELLLDYMDFAICTGMRPGTEIDQLTWSDLQPELNHSKLLFFVAVRKGKTTKYTGTREIVCREAVVNVISRLASRFPNRQADDKIFVLPCGKPVKELPRHFDRALTETGLKESKQGQRTLYSLRHSYITWELMAQNVTIDVIARQCGTGIQMIEQHYSHVVPKMFRSKLSGVDLGEDLKVTAELSHVTYTTKLLTEMEIWMKNYRSRQYI
jgi:integrase